MGNSDTKLLGVLSAKYGKVKKSKGKNGTEYSICCPYCASIGLKQDTNFHLSINANTGAYHCFRCGDNGHASSMLQMFGGWQGAEADTHPQAEVDVSIKAPHNAAAGGKLVSVDTLDEDHHAIRYLTRYRERAFDPKTICNEFGYGVGGLVNSGVMYCDKGNKFMMGRYDTSRTLIFPVYGVVKNEVKVVGWQSRLTYDPKRLTDDECEAMRLPKKDDGTWDLPMKYFTAPGFDKSRFLYNSINARRFDYVVVTEGVFDAMSVGPCAVSLLGKNASDHQVQMLSAYWKEVILLLDPGSADVDIVDLASRLSATTYVVVVALTGYKDAGDAPREEIWKQIAWAREHQNRKLMVGSLSPKVGMN